MDKFIKFILHGLFAPLSSINHTASLECLKLLTNVLSHGSSQLICRITDCFLLELLKGLIEHLSVQLLQLTIVRYWRITYLLGNCVTIECQGLLLSS